MLRHLSSARRIAVTSAGLASLGVVPHQKAANGPGGFWRTLLGGGPLVTDADGPPALGARVDLLCRQLQAGLRERGGRLVCHQSAAARDERLPALASDRLLQSLEAAVHLLADDVQDAAVAADALPVQVELDRLDGETGRHLRLRLSGGLRQESRRCARRLRQLSTRLGAQLDLVEAGGRMRIELVLRLSTDPA